MKWILLITMACQPGQSCTNGRHVVERLHYSTQQECQIVLPQILTTKNMTAVCQQASK